MEAAPETQNEVFVWSLSPGFAGSISLSHHSRSGWQAPGQLLGGDYVSISLIVSKSLGKQEGISVKELDPGFFLSLSSKVGSAACSKKSRLRSSRRENSFSFESRAWAGRLRELIEQGAGAWLLCCCDKRLRADAGFSVPGLDARVASPGFPPVSTKEQPRTEEPKGPCVLQGPAFDKEQ